MTITEEKQKALDILISSFDKEYGKGTVKILGGDEVAEVPRLSSGIPSLDIAMGGGYPRGKITELFGAPSSGKTTITLHAIAEAQKTGGIVAFIDAEHASDLNYFKALGINIEDLIFHQPDTAEQALDVVEKLVSSELVDLIVVDSVAALVPQVELEGEMGDQQMGLHARLMSKACRKITGPASKNNVTLLMINQTRNKIGVVWGSPITTTGGAALSFYSSIRLDISRSGQVKDGDEAVANETTVKVVKNKTANPYKVANFQIKFGEGVDKNLDLLRIAVDNKLVDKSGAWYSYKGERLGQGEANTAAVLKETPELVKELTEAISKLTKTKSSG